MAKDTRSRNQKAFTTDTAVHHAMEWASVSVRTKDALEHEVCDCALGSSWIRRKGLERKLVEKVPEDLVVPHVHWDKVGFEYGPAPLCLSGGFGAAKTYPSSLKALYISDRFPRNRGVICRKVSKELERTTQATFFKICPPQAYDPKFGGRRADSENYLRLARNESEILWLHLDDPDIAGVIRGLEINWFFIDQAEETSEEIYDMLSARLGRWDKCFVPDHVLLEETGGATLEEALDLWPWKNDAGRPLPPTYAMIAVNPDVETHWIYKRFHPDSPDHQKTYKKRGYRMIQMSSLENRYLPDQNVDEMLSKDPSFIRRFVHGEWGIPEGQIHTIHEASIIPGSNELVEFLKKTCTLHRFLDHGDSAPTCCLWAAIDQSGNMFFYREYYMPDKLVSYHRREIAALSGDEKYRLQQGDPSIFYKTQQKYGGKWSTSDEYSDRQNLPRETAIDWMPADNDELGTRNRINEMLRYDPNRINPITGERGSPSIFFLQRNERFPNGCQHSILQTRTQRRVRIGTEDGKPLFGDERDDAIVDHAYDCVRYSVASRAPKATEKTKDYPPGSFGQISRELSRFNRANGWQRLREQARRSYGA